MQNKIFGDDIRLERIIENNGKPIIVTSQPAIKGVDAREKQGIRTAWGGAYYDAKEGLLVFDLLPKNAKLAADGVVYPIDPVIQRINPDFADFLRQHPDRINNLKIFPLHSAADSRLHLC